MRAALLVFLLIMAICLSAFLGTPEIDLQSGALYGFLTGFGWIFFGIAVVALFGFGVNYVLMGLAFFLEGLQQALFPLGEP